MKTEKFQFDEQLGKLEFDKTKYKGEYRYEKSMLCIGTDTYIIYAL